MNSDFIQTVMDVVMEYFAPYLAPALLVFASVLFADRLIDVFYDALAMRRRR